MFLTFFVYTKDVTKVTLYFTHAYDNKTVNGG